MALPLRANSPPLLAAPLAGIAHPPAVPAVAAPVLGYAAPTHATTRRTPMRAAQLVLALPGLVAPFVGFTFSTSPLDCVRDWGSFGQPTFFLLGSPFFAAFAIVAWQIRRLASLASPARWERATLTLVAVIATLPTTAIVSIMVFGFARQLTDSNANPRGEDVLVLLAGLVPLVAGVALAVVRRRRGQPLAAIEALLVTGYLANAAMCLLAFHSDPELGYWLTVSATASFAIDWLCPRA